MKLDSRKALGALPKGTKLIMTDCSCKKHPCIGKERTIVKSNKAGTLFHMKESEDRVLELDIKPNMQIRQINPTKFRIEESIVPNDFYLEYEVVEEKQ